MILTSEDVSTQEAARTVLEYYERRWLIEEFHKAWKSGCKIEQRPVQAVDTLERLAVITAQIAVRLLQLRSVASLDPDQSCERLLSPNEWQCLWATVEPTHPVPRRAPSTLWALRAIAKLAGWRDTKRTARVGWNTLWTGWVKLQDRVLGWDAAQM